MSKSLKRERLNILLYINVFKDYVPRNRLSKNELKRKTTCKFCGKSNRTSFTRSKREIKPSYFTKIDSDNGRITVRYSQLNFYPLLGVI